MKIELIASSTIHEEAALRWIHELGFPEYQFPIEATPTEKIIICAAKRCYLAFDVGVNLNLTRVRDEVAPFINNIISSGHGSVLEHVTFTFAIEGVSRVLTAELNRHRAGVAISEGSGRYIRLDRIEYRVPDCFLENPLDHEELAEKKHQSREIMRRAFFGAEGHCAALQDIWSVELAGTDFHVKKTLTSAIRRVVPIGHLTGGVWTFNVRALRHVITMRASSGAEEEVQEMALTMLGLVRKQEPILFADFDENGKPKYAKV